MPEAIADPTASETTAHTAPLQRSRHLSWFQRGPAVYAFHDQFGYLLEMSGDLKEFIDGFQPARTEAEAVAAGPFTQAQVSEFVPVLAAHRLLVPVGDDEATALDGGFPTKGPWRTVHLGRDGVVAVVSRGFREEPYAQPRLLAFVPFESALWLRIDGEQTVRQLAEAMAAAADPGPLGAQPDVALVLTRVRATVAAWTHHSVQLTKILDKPHSRFRQLPPYAASTMPYAPFGSGPQPAFGKEAQPVFGKEAQADGASRDLTGYHETTIEDAEAQFEELETTLSHLFCEPHPALHGRTYAQAFAAVALERGWLHPPQARVVEVGGGTGRFAAGLVQHLRETHGLTGLRYTVIDLSPALHAVQTVRLHNLTGADAVLGHAEQLDLQDGSVDLLISNEVIADLRIGFVQRADLETDVFGDPVAPGPDSDPEALAVLARHPLVLPKAQPGVPVPDRVPVQLGAIRLLEHLARVLKPGGTAVLTEFGEEHQLPIESTHLDHAEFSVHFGHLMTVATALGLQATLEPVPQLLGLRDDVMVLATTRTQFRNLRHLLRAHGGDLLKRALTAEQFVKGCGDLDPRGIDGLQWSPVGRRVMGLQPPEFKALILRRPG